VGSDRHQLKRMSEQAREALGSTELTALADRRYYTGEEIKACTDAGIVPLVPKVLTSKSRAEGRYDKSDFVYDPQRDTFRCPAGEYATRRFTSVEKSMAIHKYWTSACPRCALRAKCTTAEYRRIGRWGMKVCLTRCSVASTTIRRPCRYGEARQNTRSERSRHGWAPPTSCVEGYQE
jgi:hypothetical protein